jgi:hypothetical protein
MGDGDVDLFAGLRSSFLREIQRTDEECRGDMMGITSSDYSVFLNEYKEQRTGRTDKENKEAKNTTFYIESHCVRLFIIMSNNVHYRESGSLQCSFLFSESFIRIKNNGRVLCS